MGKKDTVLEDEQEVKDEEPGTGAEEVGDEVSDDEATGPEPSDWDEYRDHHLGAVIDNEIMGDKEAQDAAFDSYITAKAQRKLNPPEEVEAPAASSEEEDLDDSGDEGSDDGED